MNTLIRCGLLGACTVAVVACQSQTPQATIDVSALEYTPVTQEQTITVNGEAITIDNMLTVGTQLQDIALDQPVGEFDKIETKKLSDLDGYTMIYSVPSLDTPVCTKQTKQIEAAGKQRPEANFVIVSHDTPFALERFCGAHDITNVLTLSDARDRSFARQNGLYMNEYDLMTRALVVIDDNLQVVYVDYADEVTSEVDLLNAFAYLQTVIKTDG